MRTLDVIEFVVAHRQGVVAQEIAGALAIPVSSLSYLLATLTERGYLSRSGRRYLPGPGLQRLHARKVAECGVEAGEEGGRSIQASGVWLRGVYDRGHRGEHCDRGRRRSSPQAVEVAR